MDQLPETGFLRLPEIIGEKGLTEEQAQENRRHNEQARADAIRHGRLDKNGNPKYARRKTTPKPTKRGIYPISQSGWWQGVKDGIHPPGIKLSPGVTAWTVESIRELIAAKHRDAGIVLVNASPQRSVDRACDATDQEIAKRGRARGANVPPRAA